MNLYWGAGAALLVYLALAWITGSLLHLDSTRFYLLFAILATLGISATAIFYWFRSRKTDSGAAGAPRCKWHQHQRDRGVDQSPHHDLVGDPLRKIM